MLKTMTIEFDGLRMEINVSSNFHEATDEDIVNQYFLPILAQIRMAQSVGVHF